MSFDKLIVKVRQAENAVEAHERKVSADVRQLKSSWLAAWTPGRIVIAGLAAGFLVGHARPRRAIERLGGLGGTRWIQLAGMASSMFASLQSTVAATKANDAADVATASAQTDAQLPDSDDGIEVDVEVATPPSDRRRRPDPTWATPPPPAEAATELSEH